MEYKEINADTGKRLEFDNGTVVYMPDDTTEGFCYIDYEAFKTGKGICYIREAEFKASECGMIILNEEQVLDPPEDICNRKQFIDLCSTIVGDYKREFGADFGNESEEEGFIQDLAEHLMYTAEWAGIDMYIAEWDLIELYGEYIDNKRQ